MNRTASFVLVGGVIPQSAHSAYDKAAQYFQIKLRRAPVAANFRADVKGNEASTKHNHGATLPMVLLMPMR